MLDRAEAYGQLVPSIPLPHVSPSARQPFRSLHRISAVKRDKVQTTKINFKDADGKTTSKLFTFEHVLKTFKPLS